ncbi:MAG: HAD family hydrolase [Planctomycetota bacterium]|nr:HAD family hydrolase [Planctomycetota bacterium]
MISFPGAFSIDAYDTLFDLSGRLVPAFADFFARMGVSADPARVVAAWLGAGQRAFIRRYEQSADAPFRSVRELNVECFEEAFRTGGIRVDVEAAADMADECLRGVEPFPDAHDTVRVLARLAPVALLSDIDEHQIGPVLMRHPMPFSYVILSERERAYKISPDGRLFRIAAERLGVPIENLIHIGDSLQDVIGGRRAGVRVVWVNRRGIQWPRPDHPPHAEVSSLRELIARLDEILSLPAIRAGGSAEGRTPEGRL